jgi:hypothetical protein
MESSGLYSRRRGGVAASRYDILVDGERAARLSSEDSVRAWIATYRHEHAEDDPAAVHLQILERGALAWLTGGKLVGRERFL